MSKEECFKDYADFLKNLNLLNISIKTMSFEKHNLPGLKGTVSINMGMISQDPDYSKKKDILTITQAIDFEMNKESKEDEVKLFELHATYEIFYRLKKNITEDIFKEYSKTNVPKILHPYIRELITNALSRSGMPAISLPLFENI